MFGVVLGTLGRQGNPAILSRIEERLNAHGKDYIIILLSELSPTKLAKLEFSPDNPQGVQAWVQIACPRLSIDWGYMFSRPLLNPYEAMVALGNSPFLEIYPMDYYAKTDSPWSNYFTEAKARYPFFVLLVFSIVSILS